MAANLPVAFGALLAGGLLLEHGISTTKAAFSGSSAQAATPAGTSTSATGSYPVGKAGAGAGKFTVAQQTFATRLAEDTGLDLNVIYAWMQNEQPPGSAAAPNGANNWLNIGSTGSGFFGGANPAWKTPSTAADESAKWLNGQAIYGYQGASGGIRAILNTVGQSAQAQIHAIQTSGWAASGYPSLPSIYSSIAG